MGNLQVLVLIGISVIAGMAGSAAIVNRAVAQTPSVGTWVPAGVVSESASQLKTVAYFLNPATKSVITCRTAFLAANVAPICSPPTQLP